MIWTGALVPGPRRFWSLSHRPLAWFAIAVMAILAAAKFWVELDDLLWDTTPGAAVDVHYYFTWTHAWFSGINIYAGGRSHEYPPASLLLLYPLTGWLDWTTTRWVWGLCATAALVILLRLAWRETMAGGWRDRVLVALLILSNNGTGSTFGNGQATYFIVLALLAGALLLHRSPARWRTDALAAACFVIACVKPNLAAPFVWLWLIFPQGWRARPILLAAAGYAGLTLVAVQFVDAPVLQILRDATRTAAGAIGVGRDPNLQSALTAMRLPALALPASILLWAGLGHWIWRHRRADLWSLLAASALVTRLWSYHRNYDDLLLLLPEIALWRITHAASMPPGRRTFALTLLILNAIVVLTPIRRSYLSEQEEIALLMSQAIVWTITLLFFLRRETAEIARNSVETDGHPEHA